MSLRQTQNQQNQEPRARRGTAEKWVKITPGPSTWKLDVDVEDLDSPSEERKRERWMSPARCFLEWSHGLLESFGHPWDWSDISVAGRSSTHAPAPPPFPFASPDKQLCISGRRPVREGESLTQGERLGQPQCSESICWLS